MISLSQIVIIINCFLINDFSFVFSLNVYSSSESETDRHESKKTKREKEKRCNTDYKLNLSFLYRLEVTFVS